MVDFEVETGKYLAAAVLHTGGINKNCSAALNVQKVVCCVIQQVETHVMLEGCVSEALHTDWGIDPNNFVMRVQSF